MARHKLPYAVFGIIQNEKGEILLLQRANTSFYDGYYDFPAGHGEPNEDMHQAVLREVEEETGLTAQNPAFSHIMHYMSADHISEYIYIFFSITNYIGTPRIMEPEKCSDLQWVHPSQLPIQTVPHVQLVLDYIKKNVQSSIYHFPQGDIL